MNNIYKYDRTLAYSSLYILIPAYHVEHMDIRIIMIIKIGHLKNMKNCYKNLLQLKQLQ